MLCHLLLYVHTNQMISIKWGSQHFFISNDVKQGGILSPVLFTMYIDVLFTILKESGFVAILVSTSLGL